MKNYKNNFCKIRLGFILIAFLATASFGQKPVYCEIRQTTRGCLEMLAERYGLESADAFFAGDETSTGRKFTDKSDNEKNIYISNNIDKYKEYIHVEVINILEKKAANREKSDFAAFVADKQGEPDISAVRVRNFKESGYYISGYEKYVDGM
jgi:hypothetical protein